MPIPIISTKLHIPGLPSRLVPRAHLISMIEAGTRGKLVLVSAPAGFGKTTLLAEWANYYAGQRLVSWVHLDENDDEPVRFLTYLIAALQAHQPHLGEAALAGLQSIPSSPADVVLTSLVNEIDALDSELILILDDYHTIETTAIHAALAFLIEHLPAHMCLVIATRTDPPLSLHRLRARGQMTEIRVDGLRFSNSESQQLLADLLGYPLPAADIAALDRRIEGWIAGLQMVALSMQGRQDVHEFIESFSASNRFILDYLTEEIYNQQPAHIQKFLLQTSILEQLSGPLCDAVLGAGSPAHGEQENLFPAQRMLEHLERANLFLLPLDEERCWYRYHRLFANLLRQRLRQTWPDETPGLLHRASAWCAANGYVDEAFRYALQANDIPAAAQLVEGHALTLLIRGDLITLLGWLNKLPDEVIFERPWLCVFFGWALLLTGNLENIEHYLSAAEGNLVRTEDPDDLRGHIAAIRAYALSLMGEMDRAYVLAHEALDLLPEENLTVRCVMAFVLGGINYARGDMPAALEAMQEAGRTGEQAGNIHLAVSALNAVGDLLRRKGDLAEAEQTYERALKLGTGRSGRPLPIAAGVYSSLAEIRLARNDLESAREFANRSLELAGQWGHMDNLAGAYLTLADVARLEGNSAVAQSALDEARRIAASHSLTPGFEQQLAAREEMLLKGHSDGGDPVLGLIDPLSDRELEVLCLFAKGFSNQEVADRLIISLGTVKAHSSNIYSKLNVRNRAQAVMRARELKLL